VGQRNRDRERLSGYRKRINRECGIHSFVSRRSRFVDEDGGVMA
jgi:hypothetical protein